MGNNSMKRKIGENIIGGGGNIVTPDQLNPEQIFQGIIQDLSKMQVILNEIVVRYNGLVNLLVSKGVISEEELQKSIEKEIEKLKESMKRMIENEMNTGGENEQKNNIIIPDTSEDSN